MPVTEAAIAVADIAQFTALVIDRVGYDADVVGLRGRYPEVTWHRFSVWTREQDWSSLQ